MKIRLILIALAGLFAAIGMFFITFSRHDPAPRGSWQTYVGAFESAAFTGPGKLGRRVTLRIGNETESQFALNHLQDHPGLEERIAALKKGATLEIDAIPRIQAGWAAPEGEPLTILVLRNGNETLYDRDRDATGGEWIGIAVNLFGYLGLLAAVLLITIAWRLRR